MSQPPDPPGENSPWGFEREPTHGGFPTPAVPPPAVPPLDALHEEEAARRARTEAAVERSNGLEAALRVLFESVTLDRVGIERTDALTQARMVLASPAPQHPNESATPDAPPKPGEGPHDRFGIELEFWTRPATQSVLRFLNAHGLVVVPTTALADPDQAWFWAEEWQDGEREVDAELGSAEQITRAAAKWVPFVHLLPDANEHLSTHSDTNDATREVEHERGDSTIETSADDNA